MEEIPRRWPLHWLVWNNMHQELLDVLEKNERGSIYYQMSSSDLEVLDPRGRTPLMLAVTLGHVESVRALLHAGANVNCEKDGWTVVQEAVATGDPDMVSLVLERRDHQRHVLRAGGVPQLLQKLSDAPDFYVEMKWEFTSWVPLVSRMCPFDTYKVYKQGSNVRIDTTLLGFEQNKWQRGNRTYIFKGKGNKATMLELDHETNQVWTETFEALDEDDPAAQHWPTPSANAISQRLTAPVCTNYLDTEKISFERNKSGIWGWRQDKMEAVNGYECKVFGASNVELVSKTRTEHLSGTDKARAQPAASSRPPLLNFLAIADTHEETTPMLDTDNESTSVSNPCNITAEEYFSEEELAGRDIGRPKEIATKIQKFKATLWLCETYPLQLQEQIMPILDLMASMSSPHFAKLKDFIQMQLPSGFPVKIEIPLFHVLNARITFGNIFGMEEPIPLVQCINEEERLSCVVDDACFNVPTAYSNIGTSEERRHYSYEEEEDLLQYAIQQSLLDSGNDTEQVDIWEALKAQRPSRPVTPNFLHEEERQLQRTEERCPARCPPLAPSLHPSMARSLPPSQASSLPPSPTHSLCSTTGRSNSYYAQMKSMIMSRLSGNLPRRKAQRSLSPAIQASLKSAAGSDGSPPSPAPSPIPCEDADPELAAALQLSRQDLSRQQLERQREEWELQQILKLSLVDK